MLGFYLPNIDVGSYDEVLSELYQEVYWGYYVFNYGLPNYNVAQCISLFCYTAEGDVPQGGYFLTTESVTQSSLKRTSSTCNVSYTTNLIVCPNSTYSVITLGLLPSNVSGTHFNLMDYFAFCEPSNCYSNEGLANAAASDMLSSLPLSTTITMAVLLPVSFLLMCAFFVILYKICCESWRKM
jgi:hypothetical protein